MNVKQSYILYHVRGKSPYWGITKPRSNNQYRGEISYFFHPHLNSLVKSFEIIYFSNDFIRQVPYRGKILRNLLFWELFVPHFVSFI